MAKLNYKLSKDNFQIMKDNLKKLQNYLLLFPLFKEHNDIQIRNQPRRIKGEGMLDGDRQRSQEISEIISKYKIRDANEFAYLLVSTKNTDVLYGERIVNFQEILDKINSGIEVELKSDYYVVTHDRYSERDHKELVELQQKWKEVITKEQLLKIIVETGSEYSAWEYSPYSTEVENMCFNLACNENAEILDSYVLDNVYLTILKEATKKKAEKIIKIIEIEEEDIRKAIEILLPICEKAAKGDDCWENNFFGNVIKGGVKKRMEERKVK